MIQEFMDLRGHSFDLFTFLFFIHRNFDSSQNGVNNYFWGFFLTRKPNFFTTDSVLINLCIFLFFKLSYKITNIFQNVHD